MTASSQECHSFFSMFFVFVVPVRMTNFLPEMTSVMPTSYGLETMGSSCWPFSVSPIGSLLNSSDTYSPCQNKYQTNLVSSGLPVQLDWILPVILPD